MLEVHPTSGAIQLNFRRLEAMAETCSLDVADAPRDKPLTLKELGAVIGVTNERVRQIQEEAYFSAANRVRNDQRRGAEWDGRWVPRT